MHDRAIAWTLLKFAGVALLIRGIDGSCGAFVAAGLYLSGLRDARYPIAMYAATGLIVTAMLQIAIGLYLVLAGHAILALFGQAPSVGDHGGAGPAMSPQRLLRILLKVLGVALAAEGLVRLIQDVTVFLFWMDLSRQLDLAYRIAGGVSSLVLLAVGIYLTIGGRALMGLLAPQVAGICARCGYDLRGCTGPRCPECGGLIDVATQVDSRS
jgi:hypothetical protein